MSKNSILKKGGRFVNAHNARIVRALKAEARAMRHAEAHWRHLVANVGLWADETEAAKAAKIAAERGFWAKAHVRGYITPNDKLIFAVMGRAE